MTWPLPFSPPWAPSVGWQASNGICMALCFALLLATVSLLDGEAPLQKPEHGNPTR